MKKYFIIVFFLFLIIFNINSEESKKDIFHNFSGAIATGFNISFVEKDPSDHYSPKVLAYPLFYEMIFKFDYLFLKTINSTYKVGFGLSIGDSINIALYPPYFVSSVYNGFYNRVEQKITFANMFGNEANSSNYLLMEIGLTFSLVNFFGYDTYYQYSDDGFIYYTTLFTGPYLFIGSTIISKSKKLTNIVGGFLEFNFDLGKFSKASFVKQNVLFYMSIGVEYRIGHTIKQ